MQRHLSSRARLPPPPWFGVLYRGGNAPGRASGRGHLCHATVSLGDSLGKGHIGQMDARSLSRPGMMEEIRANLHPQ